jgi:hypothetical protein
VNFKIGLLPQQQSSDSFSPIFNNIRETARRILHTTSYCRIVTAQSLSTRTASLEDSGKRKSKNIENAGTNRISPPATRTKQTNPASKPEPGEPDTNRISQRPENTPQPQQIKALPPLSARRRNRIRTTFPAPDPRDRTDPPAASPLR